MPALWNFRARAREERTVAQWNFTAKSPRNDTAVWNGTFHGLDLNGVSARVLGLMVDADQGAGIMRPLPASSLGPTVTIAGSLEGWGVRTLSITNKNGGLNPLRSAVLRGSRHVKVRGVRGIPGGKSETLIFDGHFRDAGVEHDPIEASIVAEEGAALNQRFVYTLAARSYKTREWVVRDICAKYSLVPGIFDWPDEGGYVFKEINEPGDKTVGQFLAAYVAPTGRRILMEANRLNVQRFLTTDTPVRALTFADILDISGKAAPPIDPNQVYLSAKLYPYVGPDLTGTIVEDTTTAAAYTTVVATHKQDHVTGAITPLSLTGTALGSRLATRTTTTREGGTVITRKVETYGAYAPKACNKKLNADGTTRFNEDFDVFLFPDGTWRTVQEESWQVVNKTVLTRTFDANGWHVHDRTEIIKYFDFFMPIAQYNASLVAVPIANRYVKDDGSGWQNGKEVISALDVGGPFTLIEFGTYDPDTKVLKSWSKEVKYLRTSGTDIFLIAGGPANGRYKFGPSASPYDASVLGFPGTPFYPLERWFTVYTSQTSTSYRAVKTNTVVRDTTLVQGSTLGVFDTASDTIVPTPIPTWEQKTAQQAPQPADVTMSDKVRIALNRGLVITSTAENGWCENRTEMNTVALDNLRIFGATLVTITTYVDWNLGEGDVITIPPHPELGMAVVNLLVWSNSWTLDFAARTGVQVLECLQLGQELAA